MENLASLENSEFMKAYINFIGPRLTSDELYRRAKERDEQANGTEHTNPLTWQIRMAELVAAGRIELQSSVDYYATHFSDPATESSTNQRKRKNLATWDRINALAKALPPA